MPPRGALVVSISHDILRPSRPNTENARELLPAVSLMKRAMAFGETRKTLSFVRGGVASDRGAKLALSSRDPGLVVVPIDLVDKVRAR